MTKRLYKIENGKKLCGGCGEMAEYFNIDATIVGLLWVLLFFCIGIGFLAFFVSAFIMFMKSELI